MTPFLFFFFLFLFILLLPFPTTHSHNTTFTFTSFSLRNITLLGDSFLRNGAVGLTRSTTVPASSSGTLLYNTPLSLSPSSSSFSTSFSFSLSNPSPFSDHFSFFLSHNSTAPLNPFFALDFRTNENLVTLFFHQLNRTVDARTQGVDLTSGNLITSWIDYDMKNVSVFLGYENSSSSSKPKNPILNVGIDLSEWFRESFFVGFSGSTEGSTELHQIVSWRFESFENSNLTIQAQKNVSGAVPIVEDNHDHDKDKDKDNDILPGSSSSSGSSKRFAIGICLAIAGPVCFFVLLFVLGCVFFLRQKKKGFGNGFMGCPKEFDYKELKLATKGFHGSRVIGNGSFGTVYKAYFESSGTISAVKRSRHRHCEEGKSEFISELSIIAGLRHKNLVQLQGWCVEKGELLLVYEFMPNGSLDKMLYQELENGVNLLSFSHRFNIAIGLASVLSYLHQECEKRVIHRDIKTGNVLLDGNMNSRLGDFGLAKLMDHDKSPDSTLTAGTMGYLAPEYLQCGKATEKTDVFSYGVVVLEVACGRRPIEREGEGEKMVNLVDWVWGLHSQGRIIEAADKRLNGEFQEEEMKKLLLLGLSCANPDSEQRPSMRRVLQILNNEGVNVLVPRVKPTLSFCYGVSLTLDEIVSDNEEEGNEGKYVCEIKID